MKRKTNNNKKIIMIVAAVLVIIMFSSVIFYSLTMKNKTEDKPAPAKKTINANKLLLDEAVRLNYTISETELDTAIETLIKRSNKTETEYYNDALLKYTTVEKYRQQVEDNLRILKLLNNEIRWEDAVTDAEVEEFIKNNPKLFSAELLNNTEFKTKFYTIAKKQLVEKRKPEIINKYIADLADRQ